MKPCDSSEARICSPTGPSRHLRMCSFDLNRKGRAGTIVSGTMLLKAATLTRTMSSAPSFTCSTVSFSEPSALWPNTLMVYLPPVRSEMISLIFLTAITVG